MTWLERTKQRIQWYTTKANYPAKLIVLKRRAGGFILDKDKATKAQTKHQNIPIYRTVKHGEIARIPLKNFTANNNAIVVENEIGQLTPINLEQLLANPQNPALDTTLTETQKDFYKREVKDSIIKYKKKSIFDTVLPYMTLIIVAVVFAVIFLSFLGQMTPIYEGTQKAFTTASQNLVDAFRILNESGIAKTGLNATFTY